jgi:hypothetical protein
LLVVVARVEQLLMDHLVVVVVDKFAKYRSLSLLLHRYKFLSVQVAAQLPLAQFLLFPPAEMVAVVQ